ncbi:MAG TPA: polysaccharide deacetylase family protein [Xanthobacteraceae bacterium]|jgi:peptidoglycan/xylan/chitin deacetylase (PgdA/CDA1 family)
MGHFGRFFFIALVVTVGATGTLAGGSTARAAECPGNPDAIGTSRVLVVPPGAAQFGTMQYHDTLALDDKEVVITFDDGPLPPYSNQVLDALAAQCVKATFFLVGEMARSFPSVVRRIHDEGHTIGTHSEDHPRRFGRLPSDKLRFEIDEGIADVAAALGNTDEVAPFFRIPGLSRSEELERELAARSLVVFSSDVVADDWHHRIKPQQIIARAISRLEARGKGILLLHDIHKVTAEALPGLLETLKEKGFRIVQMVPQSAAIAKQDPEARPTAKPAASAPAEEPEPAAKLEPDLQSTPQLRHGPIVISMTGQRTLDDSSIRPRWPAFVTQSTPNLIALPVPSVSSFDPGYPAESLTAHGMAHWLHMSSGRGPWPAHLLLASPTPGPELAAPSLQDTGVARDLSPLDTIRARPDLSLPSSIVRHSTPRTVTHRTVRKRDLFHQKYSTVRHSAPHTVTRRAVRKSELSNPEHSTERHSVSHILTHPAVRNSELSHLKYSRRREDRRIPKRWPNGA